MVVGFSLFHLKENRDERKETFQAAEAEVFLGKKSETIRAGLNSKSLRKKIRNSSVGPCFAPRKLLPCTRSGSILQGRRDSASRSSVHRVQDVGGDGTTHLRLLLLSNPEEVDDPDECA